MNISSIYGVVPPKFEIYKNTTMTTPVEYSAIKSGLIHLTKYMAKYFKGSNIRVNTISLGGIEDNQPKSFLKSYKITNVLLPEQLSVEQKRHITESKKSVYNNHIQNNKK